MDDPGITSAINGAFEAKDAWALLNIAHALNQFDSREAAFHYLKDTGIIK